jgi:MFS transporter, SP family, ERD6-like sugar transporter
MGNHLFQARFGHPGAFVAALQKLRGKGTDISEEAEEIKVQKCLGLKQTVNLLMFYSKLLFFPQKIYSKLLLHPFVHDFTEKLQCLPESKLLDLFQKDYIHGVTVSILHTTFCMQAKCFYCFLKINFMVRLE